MAKEAEMETWLVLEYANRGSLQVSRNTLHQTHELLMDCLVNFLTALAWTSALHKACAPAPSKLAST